MPTIWDFRMLRVLATFLIVFGHPIVAQEAPPDEYIIEEFEVTDDGGTLANGLRAPAGAFPGAVKLKIGKGVCSGTLIAKRLVLTAAHCVVGDDGSPKTAATVLFPEVGDSSAKAVDVMLSGNLEIAPGYSGRAIDGKWQDTGPEADFALIRLPSDAPGFENRVTRLAGLQEANAGHKLYLTGYGLTKYREGSRVVLKVARQLMYAQNRLKKSSDPGGVVANRNNFRDRATYLYGEIFFEEADVIESVSVCFGDSGGGTYLVATPNEFSDLAGIWVVGVNSRINPGDQDFDRDAIFNDERDFFGRRVTSDTDKCVALGVGSTVTSVPANLPQILQMAASLGVNL